MKLDFNLYPPESSPSGQFWGIYALIGGVRFNFQILEGQGEMKEFYAKV